MRQFIRKSKNNRGQATTELAVMGVVVLILLSYLVSQGYLYNQRLGLEMYTFRKALQLSQQQERGISLQVMRDVVTPSFFTGLNRQRLMASSVVDYNPWKLYIPRDEDPEDTPTRQLMQVNEGMIRNAYFFEVPPTRIKIVPKERDASYKDEYQWVNSNIRGIDDTDIDTETGAESKKASGKLSQYENITSRIERGQEGKTIQKELNIREVVRTSVNFEDQEKIIEDYQRNDWEGDIERDADGAVKVFVDESTIPKDIEVNSEEELRRQKRVITP